MYSGDIRLIKNNNKRWYYYSIYMKNCKSNNFGKRPPAKEVVVSRPKGF